MITVTKNSKRPHAIINFLDKTYFVDSYNWTEIPFGTVLSQLNIENSAPKIPEPKKSTLVSKIEKHEVTSSKGDKTYIVEVVKINGIVKGVSCNCPGYGFRRKCKHSEMYK